MIMVTRVTLTITMITIMPNMITAKIHVRAMPMVMSTGTTVIMLAISMITATITATRNTVIQAASMPLIPTVPKSRVLHLR